MLGPDSSYSALVIHIVWNVDSDERIEAPNQLLYFLSGGAKIFTLSAVGARLNIYHQRRSPIPGKRVEPPLIMTFRNSSFLMSLSHFITESNMYLSIPSRSMPAIVG